MTCPKTAKWLIFLTCPKPANAYSESESDFNLAINSAPDFDSTSESGSESGSESDFSSVFMNLGVCIFSPYIYTLLDKLADGFCYQFS